MKTYIQSLALISILSVNSYSQIDTDEQQASFFQTVCKTHCVGNVQAFIYSQIPPIQIPKGSQSILVIKDSDNESEKHEIEAINSIKERILSFSKDNQANSFSRKLISQANTITEISYKLYFQLAVDSSSRPSFFNERDRPFYELEKEIPHELWGYYQVHQNKAYVLINDYQNIWNADYTLIHELSHLLDLRANEYVEKRNLVSNNWNSLDDLALEFRATLAEAQYRYEILNSAGFNRQKMIQNDFRDQFFSDKEIDHRKALSYVLDLFYPIKFKNSTTLQLQNKLHARDHQNSVIFDVINNFFKEFFDRSSDPANAQNYSVLGLYYKNVDVEIMSLKNINRRQELLIAAQAMGYKDILDYFRANNLTEAVGVNSIRTDGKFNTSPNRNGGPNGRSGGGTP